MLKDELAAKRLKRAQKGNGERGLTAEYADHAEWARRVCSQITQIDADFEPGTDG